MGEDLPVFRRFIGGSNVWPGVIMQQQCSSSSIPADIRSVCVCETWSLTLREENGLRVFENRVLRRIFGLNRNEVTGEWKKLHSGELRNMYSFPNIIRQIKLRRMRWVGHVGRMGEGRVVYKVLVGTPEGKRPLERPKHRWKDGI
jgi:hypothetical protein